MVIIPDRETGLLRIIRYEPEASRRAGLAKVS